MKKMFFCLLFLFVFIPGVSAKEIEVDGQVINVDLVNKPYFFALTNYKNYYLGHSTEFTTDCTVNSDTQQFCRFYEGNNQLFGVNVEKKYFFTNFNIRNKDTNDVVFEKNIIIEDDDDLGKFPIEFDSINLTYFKGKTDSYDVMYNNAKKYIDENFDTCPYYIMRGIRELNLSGGTSYNGEVIELNCFTSVSKNNFYLSAFSDYNSQNCFGYGNTDDYKTVYFGSNDFIYSSNESNLFLSSCPPTKDFYLGDEFGREHVYNETNVTDWSLKKFISDYNTGYYSSIIFKNNQYFIDDDVFIEYDVPKMNSKKINESVDEFDSILNQTYLFSWSNFDTTKYDYYFSYDNVDYAVMSENDMQFTFTDNGTIYFKVENKLGEVLYTYYLTVSDIGSYVNDESLNKDDYFLGDFTEHQDTSDVLDEDNSTVGEYLQWWKDKFDEFVNSKFGIISQINEIYTTYKNFSVVEGTDAGFGYIENARDRFFSCNIGNLVSETDFGKFECFPVKHDNLPFLIEEGKTFYLVSFNLESSQNFLRFGRILIMILFGTFTVLKCYKLIIQFIDEMKVGGV